ncbi:MAG: helix-turn-helix domain-containing protein, partial [Acidobacteriota bacterium]|nr:helix-turn-helix domain-containing protein [Acidobacteriota bacterium]
MLDVAVIEEPAAAVVTLDPRRARLLAEMAEPVSAAALATRVGLPRQKVNYHLRTLEKHGLVRVADERKWGGLTERRLVATARSYVVSPGGGGGRGGAPPPPPPPPGKKKKKKRGGGGAPPPGPGPPPPPPRG